MYSVELLLQEPNRNISTPLNQSLAAGARTLSHQAARKGSLLPLSSNNHQKPAGGAQVDCTLDWTCWWVALIKQETLKTKTPPLFFYASSPRSAYTTVCICYLPYRPLIPGDTCICTTVQCRDDLTITT